MSSSRIGAPQGRRAAENKAQAQLVVKLYTFGDVKVGRGFSVMGYDTPEEALMLGLAWEFYTNAMDVSVGLSIRDPKHFEMFARFFVDDQEYNVPRKLPGLYSFLWESAHMFANKAAFWPNGHPGELRPDALQRCTFNMKLLAENVRWYVDADTRFWNTLEFRIGERGADHAEALHTDYLRWLEVRRLTPANGGVLQRPANVFDTEAMESKHPFFDPAKKAGRLNPGLWSNSADSSAVVLANRASPTKRKETKDAADAIPIDIDDETAEDKQAEAARKKPLLIVPPKPIASVNPNQPISAPVSDQSLQLVPVASERKTLLRIMPVPQYGVNEGSAPKLAHVYANEIRFKELESSSNQVYSFTTPSGVSNTGDNIISIVSYQTADTRNVGPKQVIVTMLKVNANVPIIEVHDYKEKKQALITSTPLISARPDDCCVSWDGRRIIVSDKIQDGSGYWIHAFDFVVDDAKNTLTMKKSSALHSEPILACTSHVFAASKMFHLESIAAPKNVLLNAPQDMKLVSVSTNAWMQPSALIPGLNEARTHTVFVHLYEHKDDTYVACVTPLSEDGTQVDSAKTFTVGLKLPADAPPRNINDTTVPRVLWYPLPFYGSDALDQIASTTIDTTRDQALVIWCIHKDYAVVTTAPRQPDDPDYVTALTLVSKHALKPILNNLSLRVFGSDFNQLKILDDFLSPDNLLAP